MNNLDEQEMTFAGYDEDDAVKRVSNKTHLKIKPLNSPKFSNPVFFSTFTACFFGLTIGIAYILIDIFIFQ